MGNRLIHDIAGPATGSRPGPRPQLPLRPGFVRRTTRDGPEAVAAATIVAAIAGGGGVTYYRAGGALFFELDVLGEFVESNAGLFVAVSRAAAIRRDAARSIEYYMTDGGGMQRTVLVEISPRERMRIAISRRHWLTVRRLVADVPRLRADPPLAEAS